MKNFIYSKIKNIYSQKSKKHKNALNINAFKEDIKHSNGGFIVDEEQKEYIIVKIYFES